MQINLHSKFVYFDMAELLHKNKIKEEKVLQNQKVLLTPIVRNGKQATVGYAPEIWKGWV